VFVACIVCCSIACTVLIKMDDPSAVVLAGVFRAKRQTLSFLWKTRRFDLCADRTLRRYDGQQLRHSANITSTTSVAKVGDAEFTVTFLQPDLRYHMRAASSAERDMWVSAIADVIAAAVTVSNRSMSLRVSDASAAPSPSSATAAAPVINFATEWLCERGLVWPKAVDYQLHCPKRHTLTACALLPLCHVCGGDACSGSGMTCAAGCTYCVCAACLIALQQPRAPAAACAGGGGFPSLGVAPAFLQAFNMKWRHVIRGWTTEQVCQQLIKALTSRSGSSMCEDLRAAGSGDVGEANMFLSHTWGDVFLDTVDAALGAAEQAAERGQVFIWFDVFSTSQHSALDIPSSEWMCVFREAIEKMGSVAMVLQPWSDPLALKRAW
jgi:hypothetical protein